MNSVRSSAEIELTINDKTPEKRLAASTSGQILPRPSIASLDPLQEPDKSSRTRRHRCVAHFDGVVENVDAAQHAVAGIDAEFDFFG